MNRFATLEKLCGSPLSIEALTEFQQAMREYEVFMAGMREMLAPVRSEREKARIQAAMDDPWNGGGL